MLPQTFGQKKASFLREQGTSTSKRRSSDLRVQDGSTVSDFSLSEIIVLNLIQETLKTEFN